MKRLFKLFVWLLILVPIVLVAVVLFSIENQPLVESGLKLTPGEIERAKALVKEHDPRTAREGEVKSVSLTEPELNLIGNYLAHTKGGGARVSVSEGLMDVKMTLKLPESPLGRYLNVSVGLREASVLPRFREVKLGNLSIPAGVADFVLEQTLDYFYSQPGYSFAEDVIQEVKLSSRQMKVTYKWSDEITEAVRSTLFTQADQQRIKVFQEKLSRVVARGNFGKKVSLPELVEPLFALARERASDGDPIADNRAAILVLAAYVNGKGVKKMAPDVGELASIPRVKTFLQNRHDLTQHFFISAALAAEGGSTLSQAIGLYKEVDDSRGGSGFSFSDLQADNAGTLFGELAIKSKSSAKQLQKIAGENLTEITLVPNVDGLPSGLNEAEFKARYGEVGSSAYNEVLAEISKRIASSPLYQ